MGFFIIGMGRVLAIDYGLKRCGMAVSDPSGIIAFGLDTASTDHLFEQIERLFIERTIIRIVVGMPVTMQNRPSQSAPMIEQFIVKLKQRYPQIAVETMDERFTSKMAMQAMIDGGVKKMARRNKHLVDKTSAVIMLQDYLDRMNQKKTSSYGLPD